MRLQISTDGDTWTQLVTTSNRAPYTWEGWSTSESAQYVRLVFDNPNGDSTLGYVAEVQVWGTGSAGGPPDGAMLVDVRHRLGHVRTRRRDGVPPSLTDLVSREGVPVFLHGYTGTSRYTAWGQDGKH